MSTPESQTSASRAPVERPRTQNQIRASMLTDRAAGKAHWKTLIADAKLTWPQISTEELATVHGERNRLAGIVQLRCHLSREATDIQVRAFLDKHAIKA
ncbi:hypothetical protein E4T66_15030 [Sinimarinibacterium sp. CAU 1509]|uniref:hypothetical protein n=1 Tax=Sinimarinibacterium sp. CAU 1509 TaxID=2562283 RepID=UPI0010AD0815|nr:hypothetical protein [Sinimarinibacterium sp. CAU 1509]TJY58907.1 hypothetical protein E4T66_15030 [Sinimarinibacterium sp. CAU 1509]